MFAAPRLPLLCEAKLSAVLVLLPVSAASVVVALNALPAEALTDEKTRKQRVKQSPKLRTHPPRLLVAGGRRKTSLRCGQVVGFYYGKLPQILGGLFRNPHQRKL